MIVWWKEMRDWDRFEGVGLLRYIQILAIGIVTSSC